MHAFHPRPVRVFYTIALGVLLLAALPLLVAAQSAGPAFGSTEPAAALAADREQAGLQPAPHSAPEKSAMLAPAASGYSGSVPFYNLPVIEVQVNDVITDNQHSPAIAKATDAITLYTVWSDERSTDPGIYVADSTDGGFTWSSSRRVAEDFDSGSYPDIAVGPNGTIYVAWSVEVESEYWTIYVSNSSDGGYVWSQETVTNTVDTDPVNIVVEVDGNGIAYVKWDIHTGATSYNVYVSTSSDGGETWGTPTWRLT